MPVTKLTPQNFEVVSGNDKVINVTVLDEDGNAVDLSGSTIVWAVAISEKSKSTIFSYTSPTNITITDASAGKFRIDLEDTDTEALSIARIKMDYYHEARVVSSGGKKTTVMVGTMTVLGNIIPA